MDRGPAEIRNARPVSRVADEEAPMLAAAAGRGAKELFAPVWEYRL